MANESDNDRMVVLFRNHSVPNEGKSKEAGRPVFDDMEVCEIRFAGDRNRVSVFPALAFARWVTTPDGSQEQETYAERFRDQYRRFKERQTQVQSGTPLSEVPFITQAKRLELRALNIHTLESLAALEGQELKNIGQGGRELKVQAEAYIEAATDTALVTKQAAEIEALKQRLAVMEQPKDASRHRGRYTGWDASDDLDFDNWEDGALKAWIKDKTGAAPRGNPSHATLVSMAEDLIGPEATEPVDE